MRLRELGIQITMDCKNCTHLAAPKILRTQKFLCGIAHSPMVLTTGFIEDCIEQAKKLRPEDYVLKDLEGESRHHLTLAGVAARAHTNKGHLLRGQNIYCTEHIYGGFETYKSIVEANGGRCLLYRARAGSITTRKVGSLDGEDEDEQLEEPEYMYLISGPKPEEQRLWPKFRQMVEAIGKRPRIVRTDWMLDLALSQQAPQWSESYEVMAEDAQNGAEA